MRSPASMSRLPGPAPRQLQAGGAVDPDARAEELQLAVGPDLHAQPDLVELERTRRGVLAGEQVADRVHEPAEVRLQHVDGDAPLDEPARRVAEATAVAGGLD